MLTISEEFDSMSIEDLVRELESIVDGMESEDVSLEEGLEMYERGVELRDACQKKLASYERRVEQLLCKGEDVELSLIHI